MKSLPFSAGLATLLALSNFADGQINSNAYLVTAAEPRHNHGLLEFNYYTTDDDHRANVAPTPDDHAKALPTVSAFPATGPEDEIKAASLIENIRTADYIEFGSVGFFPNAAIMHSSFYAEMRSLAIFMKENPTIRLTIHGHCNGSSPRTIITMGSSSNYFEVNCNNQIKTTSATELSELRALSAKQYLAAEGVSPNRIEVVAEGGNKMIYPLTSLHAEYNDRIELEIIRP